MMRKLFLLAVLVGIAYGVWKYFEGVHQRTEAKQDLLKRSEKTLREMEGEKRKK